MMEEGSRPDPMEDAKRDAGRRAVAELADGMCIGLGTGSTARLFVEALAEAVHQRGLRPGRMVTTSEATASLARRFRLEVDADPERAYPLDIDIDGADRFDRTGCLVKGMGGALLREKCIAAASQRFLALVDPTKEVPALKAPLPIPVEVIPFTWQDTARRIAAAGLGTGRLRTVPNSSDARSRPFLTDGGHYILDVVADAHGPDLHTWGQTAKSLTGVVEHGLFLVPDLFPAGGVTLVIGHGDGTAECFTPGRS